MYTYKRLDEISKTVKPYRGSTNRFPTGNRLHSTKNFFAEELDGERVFKVTYGVTSERVFITEEQYEQMGGVRSVFKGEDYETNKPEYWYYTTKPYELGIMRPDETFEFTTPYLHQGTNMYLTSEFMRGGLIACSSRHGGVIYKDSWRNPDFMFPIFKGLRIHTDTLLPHESLDIKLYKKNIDRKLAKPMLAEYGDMIKTSGVMFSAMDNMDLFVNEAKEIITVTVNGENTTSTDDLPYMTPDNVEKLVAEAKKSNQEGRYFDCAVINAYLMDAGRFQYILRWGSNSYYRQGKAPLHIHQAMVRGLTKRLYKNEEPFTKTLIEWGTPYSSSDWGFDLVVNGKEESIYG